MKTTLHKKLILAVAFAAVLVASSCNEQNLSDAKMHRLIANENRHLKDQLHKCQSQMEEYIQKKEASEERSKVNIKNLTDLILGENKKIVEDNKKLKEQIEQLVKEIERLKGG